MEREKPGRAVSMWPDYFNCSFYLTPEGLRVLAQGGDSVTVRLGGSERCHLLLGSGAGLRGHGLVVKRSLFRKTHLTGEDWKRVP